MYGREKNINIIFFLLLSSLAVGQNTLPMNVDTVFAKKNLKVGKSLFLMDTSYRKSGKVLSVDSLTGRIILVNNSAAPENFANTDLTFTGNRLHTGNGYNLEITNLNNSTISANNSIENIGVSKTIQAQDNIILSSTNGNGSNVTTIQSNGTLNQITDNTTGYTLTNTAGGQELRHEFTNVPNTVSSFIMQPERGNLHFNLESGLIDGTEYETIQTRDTTIELTVKNSDDVYSGLKIEPNSFEIKTKSNQSTATPGQVLTLIDASSGECDWADATGGTGINIYNSDGTLSTDRNIYGADNSLYINSLVDLTMQGNGAFNIINNNTDQSSAPAINIEGNSFSSGGNAEGVRISGSSDNSLAVNIIGNSSTTTDIQIEPQNGKLVIGNLPTDNTADQLMGKDASGYSVWVDKSSISGSSTIDTIILQGSIDTLVLNSAVDTVSVTYTQLNNLLTNSLLETGKTYIILDFQTVYDQMDFDSSGALKPTLVTKTGSIEQIWVLALAPNQIASQAYSATYPNDQIKYDWTYNVTPQGAAAKGRISERVDENNNRTDYDHREIKFIRYDDGVGNFIQIRDSGRASGEFLTFVQNFTGGNVKENWLGDFYSIGVSVGQEYPNNIFKGGQIWSNTSSAVFYNNTFSSVVYSNTFKGDVYSNTFKGDVYHNTFRGAIYKNTFSNYVTMNTFDIIVANNLFNDEVFRNKFSSSIANNKFTYTGSLQNTTIEGVLINKTITNVTYPFLFNTDYKKEILKASNGNTYIRYFDGTADVNTLIP